MKKLTISSKIALRASNSTHFFGVVVDGKCIGPFSTYAHATRYARQLRRYYKERNEAWGVLVVGIYPLDSSGDIP